MKVKIDRCDTLWFIIPTICIDFHPKANRVEIALALANWQIALDFPRTKVITHKTVIKPSTYKVEEYQDGHIGLSLLDSEENDYF